MNLTAQGKKALSTYVDNLNQLQLTVENTKPVNKFLLRQIAALRTIALEIAEAWDSTFELSLLNNSYDYLYHYNVVNNGDGSWAIALSDDNSRKLAKFTSNLFTKFKYNLSYIEGLPSDEEKLNFFGMQITYSNPEAIIDSAIYQIEGAIEFYDYLKAGKSLKDIQEETTRKIPQSYHLNHSNQSISHLIKAVCQIPASYLRDNENRSKNNNVVFINQDAYTGALGIYSKIDLLSYLETYAFQNKNEQPLTLTSHIQPGKVIPNLVMALESFVIFAEKFAQEKHANYKIEIITRLQNSVSKQLALLATKEKLQRIYTASYSDMYIQSKKLEHYQATSQTEKENKQKGITIAAIQQYVGELQQISKENALRPIMLQLENLNKLQLITTSHILDIIYKINVYIINPESELAIAPSIIVHQLLKEISALNLEHVNLVKENRHTLGETGDNINNLYSSLLNIFAQLTIAEEPLTMIQFGLIDNLIKEIYLMLSPEEEESIEKEKSNNVSAIQQAGGSPVFIKRNSKSSSRSEDDNVFDLTFMKNSL